MLLIMVAVTMWSAHDGGRSPELTVAASIAVVAAVKVLSILTAMLPASRWVNALSSAVWVVVFMPTWDWLANRFVYPDTLWTAVVFGSGYGLVRLAFMPGKSARPPF